MPADRSHDSTVHLAVLARGIANHVRLAAMMFGQPDLEQGRAGGAPGRGLPQDLG
jgi:hypothetical protein